MSKATSSSPADLSPNSVAISSFEAIVDGLDNYAMLGLDMRGRVIGWSKGAQIITGCSKSAVLGRYFDFLYPPQQRQAGVPARHLCLAQESGYCHLEGWLIKRGGGQFLADITIAPFKDPDSGSQLGFIKVVRDITTSRRREDAQLDDNEVLRTEIERRKAIEAALQHSNDELEAFASAASHDLQEPLRMVVSYLQLLERRYAQKLDGDARDFMHFALSGALRMRELISDLVEYSRIDKLGKPLKAVNAAEALCNALENLEVSIKEKRAVISRDQLPSVRGDDVQLSQLFQNLLANAVKFGPRGVKIKVGHQIVGGEHVFSVSDNGPGIEAKHQQKIFQIFHQIDKRRQPGGSGVGLAIAKKIVTRHHGRIWVESRAGRGAAFYFTIPATDKGGNT